MEGHGVGECAIAVEDQGADRPHSGSGEGRGGWGGSGAGCGAGFGPGRLEDAGESLFQVEGGEGIEKGIEIALDDGVEVVEGEFDPVVGDAVLGEIVRADAFVAFAGTDLFFSLGGVAGVFFGDFLFEEAGAEDGQGAELILLLGAVIGAADDEAGGFMEDLDGRIGGIDALAAGAGGAADSDLEIVGFQDDVDLLGFWEDGDGDGAGMDAALGFGGGDALDTVDAAFIFESAVDVLAGDGEDDFLETAEIGGAGVEDFEFPALGFCVAGVHPVEISGEEGGFGAAGAGAQFEDGIAGVGGVWGDEPMLDGEEEWGQFGFEACDLVAGELGEFGVLGFSGEEVSVGGEVGQGLEVELAGGDELFESGVFAGEFLESRGMAERARVTESGLDFREAGGEAVDMRLEIHALKKRPPAAGVRAAGGRGRGRLLLFPFGHGGGQGSLSGLGFDHALLELVDASGGVDEFLLAGVEGVAGVADTDEDDRF
jgi:hypothetical protein